LYDRLSCCPDIGEIRLDIDTPYENQIKDEIMNMNMLVHHHLINWEFRIE